MKRLLLLAAVFGLCMMGVAWGDVIVANSMGEPDSNRAGEDLPEWVEGGTLSVDTTDTAGAGSTASAHWTAEDDWGSLYNDHYEDEDWPLDVSCCATYVNFYIKPSVDVLFIDSWCSSYDWTNSFNLDDFSDQLVTGEWNYVSIAIDDAIYDNGWDPEGYDTHGLWWELASAEGEIWFDHWTFSSTPEEGELGGGAPGPGAGDCPCGNQGPDTTEGGDICVVSGTFEAGEEVTIIMTVDGEPVGIAECGWWESRANDREDGGATYEFLGGDFDEPWDDLTFEVTQEMIDGLGEGASGYIEVTNESESHWIYYNFDELCWGEAEPPPEPVEGVSIAGSHRLEEGDDLELTAVPSEIDPIGYQWAKDGEDLEGETGATLTILDVTVDDSGVYSVVATTEDAPLAEYEDEFLVVVFPLGAMPLAGGLGLGLLAGACALAGAVSIRRKK